MSFGLSLGDFITVAKLISNSVTSLRGAEEDYQELLCELSSLQAALHHVDRLNSSNKQQPALEAIKRAALTRQLPLSNFLDQIQKYDGSLGAGKSKGLFRDMEKKSRWAFCKKKDARQLRNYLNVHIGSINMMLMTHGLEMLTVASKQAKEDSKDLRKDLECSRKAVLGVREDINAQQVTLQGNKTMLGRVFGTISGDVVPQLKALVDMATRVWQMNLQI